MSVDLFTGRIRARAAPLEDVIDGRVTTTRCATVVFDLAQRNNAYTLNESVRWLGWSNGDAMPWSYREVRLAFREPRDLVVVVACPEGATIERRDWREKLRPLHPKRQ